MLIMEVFSASLCLTHPQLGHRQDVGLLIELSISSHVSFVSADRFICQELDDHSSLAFHDTIVQTSFHIM
jgi:hypothetical protein